MDTFEDSLDMYRLMFCVLERGMKDIVKWHHPCHSKSASFSAYEDSINWVLEVGIYTEQSDHVFSFRNICDCLDLPADAIQSKLLKIMEGEDDVPEQLLGGSFWKYGVFRSTSRSSPDHHLAKPSFLLLPIKPIVDDEACWHGYPERETINIEDDSTSEEDDSSWD
jgi:hypothetical protein